MDGFTGFKTATSEDLPRRARGDGPVPCVHVAGDALQLPTPCLATPPRHCDRTGDPLSTWRRKLHTGAGLFTDEPVERLDALFAVDDHVDSESTGPSTNG